MQHENMPLSIEEVQERIKKVVPNDNTISCVQHPNGTVIILVGTAHVSLSSSDLVKKLISPILNLKRYFLNYVRIAKLHY